MMEKGISVRLSFPRRRESTNSGSPTKLGMTNVNKQSQKAFTLIELLVVVAIIGILSSVIFVSVSSSQKRARDSKRLADMASIASALKGYKLENGSYPSSANVFVDTETLASVLKPYLSIMPVDPKNDSEYYYRYKMYDTGCGKGPFAVLVFKKAEVSVNVDKEVASCSGGTLNWNSYDYSFLLQ